ncbi:threonine synthase [Eisenibacter elegans]|uniref:threonine synthase n=1 Tax=Eisenibacter elegans TaxID=997 RepID=UPI0004184A9E|nr:threonine synthase [Eisenibacter elegans]
MLTAKAVQVRYRSTYQLLDNADAETLCFGQALLRGQAADRGLYMPTEIPPIITPAWLATMRQRPYHEVATALLAAFVGDDMPLSTLESLCQAAYQNPRWGAQGLHIPLTTLDTHTTVAHLDQGPTASFKDFAAQWMAKAMQYYLPEGKQLTILVATSGDTGSAVAEAFRGLHGIRVVLLYPQAEVSAIQRLQLARGGDNIFPLAIDGKFDDCQRLVKEAFADEALQHLGLNSANSINIGRVLPQLVYYVYLYLQYAEAGEQLSFCIPSGNLGNSLGCELARRMGLPIHRLVIGTNANDAFPKWLQTGHYQPISPSRPCVSNAMNVGHPSNLARYFALANGLMDYQGNILTSPDRQAMQQTLCAYAISDEETFQTMKTVYQGQRVVLEPHTAVGYAALQRYRQDYPQDHTRTILISTAHPAKFGEIVEPCLGIVPELPPSLRELPADTQEITLSADYIALKSYLLTMV